MIRKRWWVTSRDRQFIYRLHKKGNSYGRCNQIADASIEIEKKIKELSEKELREKKLSLAKGTKYLLDFMFYAGILVTISLPFSLKYIGKYLEAVEEHYLPAVIIFAILGVLALLLVNELRKMFGTVLAENCFVPENVASLRRMGDLSFFIAAMSAVRCVVYLTIAMLVIILVFIIAGMFSKVLAMVFEEAVRYKEENDLTI